MRTRTTTSTLKKNKGSARNSFRMNYYMLAKIESVEQIAYIFESGLYVAKTIVLFYGSQHCPPCKMMAEWMRQNIKEDVVLYIDVDEFPELAEKNGIAAVPTLFLYRYDKDQEGNYAVGEMAVIKGYDTEKLKLYVL